MDARGKAVLREGRKIVLGLEPGVDSQPSAAPPHPAALVQQIADGVLLVHPSKAQISTRHIQMQICNVQRGLRLLIGAEGQWCDEADERLKSWSLCAERKKNRNDTPSPSPGALEDASSSKRLALEDASSSKLLALEDAKPTTIVPEPSSAAASSTGAVEHEEGNRGSNALDKGKPTSATPEKSCELVSPVGEVEDEGRSGSNGADSSNEPSTPSSSSSATRFRATIQRSMSALNEISDIVRWAY